MHLRKLAWALPLMLAATAASADSSGSFQEGAKLASLARPEPVAAPATTPSHVPHTGVRLVSAGPADARISSFAPTAVKPGNPSTAPAAPVDVEPRDARFEVRNFLTLVVALALVGWIQRRRRDA